MSTEVVAGALELKQSSGGDCMASSLVFDLCLSPLQGGRCRGQLSLQSFGSDSLLFASMMRYSELVLGHDQLLRHLVAKHTQFLASGGAGLAPD